MGSLDTWGGWSVLVVFCVVLDFTARIAGANLVLIGKNVSLSFNDLESNFAPSVKGSGECGTLYIADPPDACTQLKNLIIKGSVSPFVLIVRGGCAFDDKVRIAQSSGFKAAIVYDNEDGGSLVSMAGSPGGIHIHAVFISKSSGETLKKYAGRSDIELWIIPTFENSAWSIMAISFISLLAMSAVLATCFFVRRHRIRPEEPRPPIAREFHGMSRELVNLMPSLIFQTVLEDNCTSRTCAICLEDYFYGDKLRILPCRHKFHALCVDAWLTTSRAFCPVCKRDARMPMPDPPASESTPLNSVARTPVHPPPYADFHPRSALLPVFCSFMHPPPPSPSTSNQIRSTPPLRFPSPGARSISNIPRAPNSQRSCTNPLSIHSSRSTTELRNASSSSRSWRNPVFSPHFSRNGSVYDLSPRNASPSYLGRSSSRYLYLRHCDSRTSFSSVDSARSLPGCS